jgi:hypothetical protein
LRAANEREKRECLKTKQSNFKDRYFTFVSSHLGLTGSSDPSLRFGISEKRPISQQETRNHTFSHEDGVSSALVHYVSALCPGSGRDGLQQDDGLLLDAAQESGCNNFDCGRVSGSGRVFDVPISLIEQSVVAANYA